MLHWRRRLAILAAVIAGSLVVVEGTGRALGLHRPLLYEVTSYGYRVAPDQDLRRFGNRIFYNRQGLRSEPMAERPQPDVARILCIGDSITNGGTPIDQRDTYPYLLEQRLRTLGITAEVLNGSAAGWALENEEGWLRASTPMGARVVILEVATHDLFQPRANGAIVGTHPSFPDSPPSFASQELWTRYVLPRLVPAGSEDPGVTLVGRTWADAQRSLAAIAQIEAIVREGGGRLLILRVRQPRMLELSDALSTKADDALRIWADSRQVPLIEPAELVEARGGGALFRDGLHPSSAGNAALADAALPIVIRALESPAGG